MDTYEMKHAVMRLTTAVCAVALAAVVVEIAGSAQGLIFTNPRMQFFDTNGLPLNGGKLCSYQAGTSTPLATYSDAGLTTPNTNPVVLSAFGFFQGPVYLLKQSYKFVLLTAGTDNTCSTGTTIWTADNVPGGYDASVLIGGTVPTARLGTGSASSSNFLRGDATWTNVFPSGTAAAPAIGVGAATVGIYSSGTNALDFATAGIQALDVTSDQVINSPTQPRCSVSGFSGSIANNTTTALTFTTEDFDVGGMHSSVSNTSRLTVPAGGGGVYLITGTTAYTGNVTGSRTTGLRKNGGTSIQTVETPSNTATAVTQHSVTAIANLVAGDYVELVALQDSGAGMQVTSSQFAAVKIW